MRYFTMRLRRLPERLLLAAVVLLLAASGLAAQDVTEQEDEGEEELLYSDDTLQIFRDEDGRIKIRREDADEDEWLAIVDPDEDNNFVFFHRGTAPFDLDIPHMQDFRVETDIDWEGPKTRALVLSREADDVAREIHERVVRNVAPLGFHFESMDERREIAEKERESRRIAREMREAEGAELREQEAELERLLNEIFDAKQEARRERLEQLDEQADELRQELDQRQARRSEIIERRKRVLQGDSDPLRW